MLWHHWHAAEIGWNFFCSVRNNRTLIRNVITRGIWRCCMLWRMEHSIVIRTIALPRSLLVHEERARNDLFARSLPCSESSIIDYWIWNANVHEEMQNFQNYHMTYPTLYQDIINYVGSVIDMFSLSNCNCSPLTVASLTILNVPKNWLCVSVMIRFRGFSVSPPPLQSNLWHSGYRASQL
jgi:hypothetical protein